MLPNGLYAVEMKTLDRVNAGSRLRFTVESQPRQAPASAGPTNAQGSCPVTGSFSGKLLRSPICITATAPA
jgi:hypothetical protein